MSGHSKWATTKHKKAAIDAKRGKLFAKLIKNIEVAARNGGPDPDGNPTLFDAIQKAKKNSVPADNITRAVKRGGGLDGSGVNYETIMYEGYAAGGVALLIECLTDNPYSPAGCRPNMALDLVRTAAGFLVLIVVGVGALLAAPVMETDTVLMMVLPAMVVFGLVCVGLGAQYGEHRATRR